MVVVGFVLLGHGGRWLGIILLLAKSMFLAVPCHVGGRLHLPVVAGSWTSSKGMPQSGKPWLHLLEGKTQLCPGRSCLTGTNPHGSWSPAPGTFCPPLRAFGWCVSLPGRIPPCLFPCSTTFPCRSWGVLRWTSHSWLFQI